MSVSVVDASVISAIVFIEPTVAEAETMVSEAELVAPHLLRFELANIAWKKTKRDPRESSQIAAGLHLALQELEIRYLDVDHEAVLQVALEKNITAYDASYLWLARSLKAPLATFDRKLRAAM
jgi:predicted nucleic acid-binding protein